MSRHVVGVDPGLKGAIALLREDGDLIVLDMPTVLREDGKADYATAAILTLLRSLPAGTPVVLERLTPRPAQGGYVAYRQGEGVGLLRGMVEGVGLDLRLVYPQTWKAHFKLIGTDKSASVDLCRDLWPAYAQDYCRLKKHDGRADAALLARYLSEVGNFAPPPGDPA